MPSTVQPQKHGDSPESSLLGKEIDRRFQRLMEREYWREVEIRREAAKWVRDVDTLKDVHRQLRLVHEGGYQNNGKTDPETDPGSNPVFMDYFLETLNVEYSRFVGVTDDLTRDGVLAASGEDGFLPWAMVKPVLTSWIRPGADGYIWGNKRSGKTGLGSAVAKQKIDEAGTVLGAIQMLRDEVTGYKFCPSGTQLLRAFCTLMKTGLVLVLIDEGFVGFSGETPLKREVMNLRQFSRLFGKLGGSMLDISQYESDIPSELRKTAQFRAKKLGVNDKDRAWIEIQGHVEKRPFEWAGYVKWIPDGEPDTLPYRTESPAAFVMDFEVQHLMEHLTGLKAGSDWIEATLHWLDEKGAQFQPRLKRWVARRFYGVGVTQEKIAKALGVSQTWVSRVVRQKEEESKQDEEMGLDAVEQEDGESA